MKNIPDVLLIAIINSSLYTKMIGPIFHLWKIKYSQRMKKLRYFAYFNLNLLIHLQIQVPVDCGQYLWWLSVQVMLKKGTGRPMTCSSIRSISEFIDNFNNWWNIAMITSVKMYKMWMQSYYTSLNYFEFFPHLVVV